MKAARLPPMPMSKPPPLPDENVAELLPSTSVRTSSISPSTRARMAAVSASKTRPEVNSTPAAKPEIAPEMEARLRVNGTAEGLPKSTNSSPGIYPPTAQPRVRSRTKKYTTTISTTIKLSSHLYLAPSGGVLRAPRLEELAVNTVLILNENGQSQDSYSDLSDIKVLYFSLEKENLLDEVVSKVNEVAEEGKVCLVHSTNLSAAAMVCAAHLMKECHLSSSEALELLKSRRKEASVDFAHRQKLSDYEVKLKNEEETNEQSDTKYKIMKFASQHWFPISFFVIIFFSLLKHFLSWQNKRY